MKPGRNDPCPCGSGKKFKKCCQDKSAAHVTPNAPANDSEQPPTELDQLIILFNAKRFAELESMASLMLDEYPDSGFV